MLSLQTTSQFRKDFKRIKKRSLDITLLEDALFLLLDEQELPAKYLDHALKGDYLGFRECHIKPDWLLVYAINKEKLVLIASRTGSHADLF